MAKVFLSYRQHNSNVSNHSDRVRDFALRLRGAGVSVVLDQLANEEEFHRGGPSCPNGWSGWSYAQVEVADKVLIIGSIDYYRTCEAKEAPHVGLGAAIEAQRIFTQLYQSGGNNPRFRVVILTGGDEVGIPDRFADYHRFYPNSKPQDFNDLVYWLNPPTIDNGANLTPPPIAWPPPIAGYAPDLANRDDEFAFFCSLISGGSSERALFLEAPSNHGKTTLVAEFIQYGRQALGPGACVTVDFKGNPTREAALDTLSLGLRSFLPTFAKSGSTTRDLRADFRALASPVLLLFDTYEDAGEDARNLIQTLLLADLEATPAVRIVVAGQEVPNHSGALWAKSVRPFQIGPIRDSVHWIRFADRRHPGLEPDKIKTLTEASDGVPGFVSLLIKGLARSNVT